jgi:hypothetical protein
MNALAIMTDEYAKQAITISQLILRIATLENANCAQQLDNGVSILEWSDDDIRPIEIPAEDAPVGVACAHPAAEIEKIGQMVDPAAEIEKIGQMVDPAAETEKSSQIAHPAVQTEKSLPIAHPAAEEAEQAPLVLTDLYNRGVAAKNAATSGDAKRENACWKRVVAGIKDPCTLDEFWQHVTQYVTTKNCAESTRKKEMGVIKGYTGKLLGIPDDADFQAMYTIATAKANATTGVEMPVEELVTMFGCTDGTLLTTQKLQDTVRADLASPPADTRALMALALCAFHGNRPQDWVATSGAAVKYGEAKYVEGDYGYYEPSTKMMHLFKGKVKSRGYVCFDVGDEVAQATALFHAAHPDQTYFLPQPNGKMAETKLLLDALNKSYFAEGNAHGFPVGVTLTDLRHLYELHIRHVLKLNQTELDRIFKIIGHSNKTSVLWYSETHKKSLEFNQSVSLSSA